MSCGSCCKRILVDMKNGLSGGLFLRKEERKIFDKYPDTKIVPFIGIAAKGSRKMKVMCYQMISEPCPLLNETTNLCTDYEHRPIICREYPFSTTKQGLNVELNCSSIKTHFKDVEYGVTEVSMDLVIRDALIIQLEFFNEMELKLLKNNKLKAYMYDFNKKVWIREKD